MQKKDGTNTFSKETVTAIMMLNINTKIMICLPDGDTDFFDINAGALQQDTLVPHLFIIYLDNVLQTPIDLMKKKWSHTKKRQEVDNILQKLSWIQTMQVI